MQLEALLSSSRVERGEWRSATSRTGASRDQRPNQQSTCKGFGVSRAGSWCRPDRRLAIWLRDGLACIYCGAGPESGLSLDHVDPAGGNGDRNLVTACLSCNSARQDAPLREWLRSAGHAGAWARVRLAVRRSVDRHRAKARNYLKTYGLSPTDTAMELAKL